MTTQTLRRIYWAALVAAFTAVAAVALSGCANTFQVAEVDPAALDEERAAQLAFIQNHKAQHQRRVADVWARLRPGLNPVCAQADFDPCKFVVRWEASGDLNAWANEHDNGPGHPTATIWLTSAMIDFARNDDELANILAHEAAHHMAGHIQQAKAGAVVGGILGAILEGLGGSGGTQAGMQLGVLAGSQDREREADYLAMYILARAGFPLDDVPVFWRRMAVNHPLSMAIATSHPTTVERFVQMKATAAEIEAKRAAGQPLLPELQDPEKG